MSAYLIQIKHFCDSLVGYGQPVTIEEQQSAILNSLPLEFDHVVSIITMSRVPFDLQGITDGIFSKCCRGAKESFVSKCSDLCRTTTTRYVSLIMRISSFSSWSKSWKT
ncbi:hypothetical protein PVK06_012427 [Gossypium arboreum]|uniref:Uncharacterized protein n=1 Tax=Gossypium arboreum TaxID=29729 RepID=A0ABR0QC45_GOSAR|nr:hypothetical protein PVK06_012427 [Gossypium arboreum]